MVIAIASANGISSDASVNHAELSDDPISTFGEAAPHLSEQTPPELIQLRRELP